MGALAGDRTWDSAVQVVHDRPSYTMQRIVCRERVSNSPGWVEHGDTRMPTDQKSSLTLGAFE
eukprot:175017-Amphidinium_carterae.2